MGILIQRFILDLRLVEHRLGHWSESPSQLKTSNPLESIEFVSTPTGLPESSMDYSEVDASCRGVPRMECREFGRAKHRTDHGVATEADPEEAVPEPTTTPRCSYST